MKKALLFAAAAGTIAALKAAKPIKAHAWFSQTHKNITQSAFDLLKKEKKAKICAFYEPQLELLMTACAAPDEAGDIDKAPGTHYYSCADVKGKKLPIKGGYYKNRLGDFSKSARTSLEDNYTSAVSLYKSGLINEAFTAFGRALHFAEDISCPVHTANMKYLESPKNAHYSFEKFANTISSKYSPEQLDKRIVNSFSSESFENALNKLCEGTNKYASMVAGLDPAAFTKTVSETVPGGVMAAAAMMIRFYNDCRDDNKNYILSNNAYSFKNMLTGEYLIMTDKGIELKSGVVGAQKKLTVTLDKSGAFSLKGGNERYLLSNLKSSEKENEKMLFRAACVKKNTFRLSLGHTFYEKVLGLKKGSSALTVCAFDPEDTAQLWVIEK